MKEKIKNAVINEYKNLGLTEKAIEGLVSFAQTSIQNEEDIDKVIKSLNGLAKSFQSDADVLRTAKSAAEKRIAELEEQIRQTTTQKPEKPIETLNIDELRAEFKKVAEEEASRMQRELAEYKAAIQNEKRSQFINSEAKRIGIDEKLLGSLSFGELDDAGVTAKLTEIKQLFVNNSIQSNTPQILQKAEIDADEVAEMMKLVNK
jgi:Fe2+ transport system protein B